MGWFLAFDYKGNIALVAGQIAHKFTKNMSKNILLLNMLRLFMATL